MTRRIKRTPQYEIELRINDDAFIRAPREAQRNWVLNRAMKEFAGELDHADQMVQRFVGGADFQLGGDRTQAQLDDQEIMEDWQIPVMQAMAKIAGETQGDVLEIGFGRGVTSEFLQELSPSSHTIVECNDSVVARFEKWKQQYPDRDIRMLHGMWQDLLVDDVGPFDSIFFHTYPLNESEYVEQVVQSETFAEHFFPTAARLLRDGGVLTYLTNEISSLSRGHQRALFNHFRTFTLSKVTELDLPNDTRDALWANSIVVIRVEK